MSKVPIRHYARVRSDVINVPAGRTEAKVDAGVDVCRLKLVTILRRQQFWTSHPYDQVRPVVLIEWSDRCFYKPYWVAPQRFVDGRSLEFSIPARLATIRRVSSDRFAECMLGYMLDVLIHYCRHINAAHDVFANARVRLDLGSGPDPFSISRALLEAGKRPGFPRKPRTPRAPRA